VAIWEVEGVPDVSRTSTKSGAPRRAWLVAAALCVLAPTVRPAAAAEAEASAGDRVLPVEAVKTEQASGYQVQEHYVGRVVTRRSSSLGFQHPGLLAEMRVDEGSRVEKGELLARLDTSRFRARRRELYAELALSRATLKETEARLELARITTKRQKRLLKNDNVSRQRYDESRFEVEALQSAVLANKASIDRVAAAVAAVEVDIKLSKIFAPYAGTIVSRMADEGVALDAGTPVLKLIEDEAKEVRIGVPAKVAGRLNTGQPYDIKVGGRTFAALLRSVLTMVDADTRTVPAIFEIADGRAAAELRSGQLARIEIQYTIDDAGFWLPLAALIGGRRGLWNAMALEAAAESEKLYRVTRREVQVLYSEAERAYVRGAISDGDLVVSSGLHRVVPGQVVRLVGDGAK